MAIYLDYNATTPVDDAVVEAMLPYFSRCFGNPSSPHGLGREARRAVDHARQQVASLLSVQPGQVIFTSGGTEANNLALRGIPGQGALLVSPCEHPSVLSPAHALARAGRRLLLATVDEQGVIDVDVLASLLASEDVGLLSVMLANNETGVLQDLPRIAELAKGHGVLLHSDAAQAVGRVAVDFERLGVDLLTLSGQKIYGPKGIGALVVDRRIDIEPLLLGGSQEGGRRAGTENVAAIVGLGAAAELAGERQQERQRRLLALRRYLENGLRQVNGVVVFAGQAERLPNTTCLAVAGIDGETLALALAEKGLAVASGSACATGGREPSHVLRAMGVSAELAVCALRVSLGEANSEQDIDCFIATLQAQIETMLPTAWRFAAS